MDSRYENRIWHTHEKNSWVNKIPWEKKFGPTKSHEGTKARWHETYDGTTHAEFSALFQERLILFMYYYM